MKNLSRFNSLQKASAKFIFAASEAAPKAIPIKEYESTIRETSDSLQTLGAEVENTEEQNNRKTKKKVVFMNGKLVLVEIPTDPEPEEKTPETEPVKKVEESKEIPLETEQQKKSMKKKVVFMDGKLVLVEIPTDPEPEEETPPTKETIPVSFTPEPPKKETEPSEKSEPESSSSLSEQDFVQEHVLAGEDGNSFVLDDVKSVKLREILKPGKTFYLKSQGRVEKVTWGSSNEGQEDYIDTNGDRVRIYNGDLIVTEELYTKLMAELEEANKDKNGGQRTGSLDINDFEQKHIIMRQDGHSFELQNVGTVRLRDIVEPGRTFYIQSNGSIEKVTWGISSDGRNDYIDSNGVRAKIYDGDVILTKEYYEEIKAHPSSHQEDFDLTKVGVRPMPREQLLGAQKVPDLTNQEISPDTVYLLSLFPKDYHWGLIRLSKNLKSRGIDLTLDNPITINSVRQETGATYDPRTKTVFTFPIATGTGGTGNGFDEKSTPLGSSQVGAIKYAGYNGNASFSGKQATLKGTNIETLGLDKKSRTIRFGRGTSAEKVYEHHSLSTAMGNNNSQSVTSYAGTSGTPRGTSNHGIDDWRVEGGKTWGCIGMKQSDVKRQAEIYMAARNAGHASYIENQYDGRKVIPYMYVYRSRKQSPIAPLAKIADLILGKKKVEVPDSIVSLDPNYEPRYSTSRLSALDVNKPADDAEKEAYLNAQRLFGPGFYPHSSSGRYDNASSKVNTTFLNTKPSTVAGMQVLRQKLIALNGGKPIDIILTGGDEVGHSGWYNPGDAKSGSGKYTHWEGDKVDIRSSSEAGVLLWSLAGKKSYAEVDIGDYRFKILRHGASTNSDHFDVAVTYKPNRQKMEQFNYKTMLTVAEAQRQGLSGVLLMRLKRELSLLLLNPDAKEWTIEEFDDCCTKVRQKWQGGEKEPLY